MLEFRNGPHPPNYLARRHQGKLLMLVMLLGGAVWLALEARDPQLYRCFSAGGAGRRGGAERVDTRVVQDGHSAPLDTFVIPKPVDRSGALDAGRRAAGDLDGGDFAAGSFAAGLAAVRDDEPFRLAEHGAWFHLLEVLQSTDEAALAALSIGPTTFIQLYRQPQEYRGELVTIRGTLRRSEEIGAPANDLGITSYYQTWVFPEDNPSNPIVVYCLTVPSGFPSGMELAEPVELVGFFFKRWPYAAQDTIRTAPVVLAKGFRWIPAPPDGEAAPVSLTVLVGIAAAFASAIVMISWWLTRRATPPARSPAVIAAFDPQGGEAPAGAGVRLRILAESQERDDESQERDEP